MFTRTQWIVIVPLVMAAALANVRVWMLERELAETAAAELMFPGMQLREVPYTAAPASGAVPEDPHPGRPVETFRADGAQVLFLLSPNCPVCQGNIPHWRQLEERLGPAGVRVLVLADWHHPSITRYQAALATPILLVEDRPALEANRFEATPQTAVLDSSGTVLATWVGDLTRRLDEIEASALEAGRR